ncbi:zinc metallopeptidase [Verrucomicrobiaceae bacterium 5K15]|uniref:Zinc metallopeptidase n=1 Tax=Oceaniferula flava TaxID=2800421 RepID=A0AAE2VDV2_9BACT|nr:zinc metallopeptidase [Oceaniferula flavus]MBK1856361.1 zinc metallopeptidase [Oceaniferula flavus]MBM1137668.1 zinc metallopeptidase [Oceaniferula flavus]
MQRLIIFLSLLPILLAVILRKFNADRVLHSLKEKRLAKPAEEVSRRMLDSVSQSQVEIKTPARRWSAAPDHGKEWLVLPPGVASGVSASSHGKAALQVGLYLLSLREPKMLARRQWAIRFGHVFPVFTTVVMAFALVVRAVPAVWVLAIIMASCALAACAQFLTITAERRAADLACVVLEKKRIFPRLSDEEAVVSATRAWSWRSCLPGILSRLAP